MTSQNPERKRVLVVGAGSREHAFAQRCAESPTVDEVVVAPGNPGMARSPGIVATGRPCTPGWAISEGFSLVVVLEEEPLVAGLADDLRGGGLHVVGPSAAAARLEGSKAFALSWMGQAGLNTARHKLVASVEDADAALRDFSAPLVVKADGLADGKAVSICESHTQAKAAIEAIMRDRLYGAAGDRVVLEEVVEGKELSFLVLVDETDHLILPSARDHFDIGQLGGGRTTSGMGAIAPDPSLDAAVSAQIDGEIVRPCVEAIQRSGWTFRGFLYIGIVLGASGPIAIELNVRPGDPEALVILSLMEGDLAVLLNGLSQGRLAEAVERSGYAVRSGAACAVVATAGGYPELPSKGDPIRVQEPPSTSELCSQTRLFWAGTSSDAASQLRTARGRIVASVGLGPTLDEARRMAYTRLQLVNFSGMQFRHDIGGSSMLGHMREMTDLILPDFDKRRGLLPAIVQDVHSKDVLMLGYVNEAALQKTRSTGYATFWSTSRNELWTKGDTSGDRLRVHAIRIDCDQDALLLLAEMEGSGVCHTNRADGSSRTSCFYRSVEPDGTLINLEP